jgi:hypothetical protein
MSSPGRAAYRCRLLLAGRAVVGGLAVACTLAFGLNTVSAVAVAPVSGALALHLCTAGGYAARCGTLMVPKDRLSGTGRQIPIRVVVVPAAGPNRQPDQRQAVAKLNVHHRRRPEENEV